MMTANYFCVRHKNRGKHNQHFELLYFMINLHFDTSNLLSTYKKTSLISKTSHVLSRNPKKSYINYV